MGRKLKVYLDTSVISYLQQEDTWRFGSNLKLTRLYCWEVANNGVYIGNQPGFYD